MCIYIGRIFSLCAALAISLIGLPMAAHAVANPWGTPSAVGGSNINTLTFGNGATVTMSATNIRSMDTSAPEMNQRTGGTSSYWWGDGDYTNVFTPASIGTTTGMTVGWGAGSNQPGFCTSVTTVTPGVPAKCPTPATVTFTFSQPVSNVVMHLHNLGGGAGNGRSSFYSQWNITTGQTITMLNHAGNIETNGSTIKAIQPPGTGVTEATKLTSGTGSILSLAPQGSRTFYGTGSGSFQVLGTYSQISFSVDLYYFALPNVTNPVTTNPETGEWPLPEYVAFQFTLPTVVANPQTQTTPINKAYSGTTVLSANTANGVYSVAANPSHGTVALNANGSFVYTPSNNYVGTDVFTYKLCDPVDTWNCTNSTVTINIDATLATTGYRYMPYWVFGVTVLVLGLTMAIAARSPRRRTARMGGLRH